MLLNISLCLWAPRLYRGAQVYLSCLFYLYHACHDRDYRDFCLYSALNVFLYFYVSRDHDPRNCAPYEVLGAGFLKEVR